MIGMHTGVLQDRTLDMVRAHDEMMLTLKQHGHQKREEREQAFLDLVSTDFVGGFNEKISELQLSKIKGFSEEATGIYKQSANGRISMDDQVRLRARKAELEAFQGNLRQAAEVVDRARQTLVRDGGRNFDVDESTAKMNTFLEGWKGDTPIDMNDLLEAAYTNIPQWVDGLVKSLPKTTQETREDRYMQGDRQVTERSVKAQRMGVPDMQAAVSTVQSNLMADRNALRSAEKGLEDLVIASNETGDTRALETIATRARQLEEEYGADPRMAPLLASVEMSRGATFDDLFALGSTVDRRAEDTRSSVGGRLRNRHVPTKMRYKGEVIEGINPNITRRVPISEGDLELEDGSKVTGVQHVMISHVGYDGTVIGKYTGRSMLRATQIPGERVSYGGKDIEVRQGQYLTEEMGVDTQEMAKAIYNQIGLAGDVEQVVYDKGRWIPYVASDMDEGRTVVYKMEDDYREDGVFKFLNQSLYGFDRDFAAGRQRYEQSGGKKETVSFGSYGGAQQKQ